METRYENGVCTIAPDKATIEDNRPFTWSSDELTAYIRKKYKTDFWNLTDLQLKDLISYLNTLPTRLGVKPVREAPDQLGFNL